jgi:dTDP-4-dehydrorhamnose reductase
VKSTIFITGGSGLLALNWAITKRMEYNIILCLHKRNIKITGVDHFILDLNTTQSIYNALITIKPSIVIHTAGLTSIEKCEENPELAHFINHDIAINVAMASAKANIKHVHISTDHLFSGNSKLASEADLVSPLNVYGKTKSQAEIGVIDKNPDALIIRTNFFGWGTSYRASFSDYIIRALQSRKEIELFTDAYYTPILAEKLVEIVHELIDVQERGIFNIVSDQRISKYDFGIKLANRFGLDSTLIKKKLLFQNNLLVKRPLDMSLSNTKVCSKIGHNIGSIDSHIERLYQQYETKLFNEIYSL